MTSARPAYLDQRTVGAIAGIAGAVLFVGLFTIEGCMRPGYNARWMFVSELALGPRGVVQIGNFIAAGTLTVMFARGVGAAFPAARDGTATLALIGLGLIGAGVFVMDPLTTPTGELSWHHTLHGVAGAPVFFGPPIVGFVFARRFQRDPRWRSLAPWSIAMGVVSAVLPFVILFMAELRRSGAAPHVWGGAVQRVHHILYFAWQAAIAVRLLGSNGPRRT
jgi:Protein of unknown function (DUF998)